MRLFPDRLAEFVLDRGLVGESQDDCSRVVSSSTFRLTRPNSGSDQFVLCRVGTDDVVLVLLGRVPHSDCRPMIRINAYAVAISDQSTSDLGVTGASGEKT